MPLKQKKAEKRQKTRYSKANNVLLDDVAVLENHEACKTRGTQGSYNCRRAGSSKGNMLRWSAIPVRGFFPDKVGSYVHPRARLFPIVVWAVSSDAPRPIAVPFLGHSMSNMNHYLDALLTLTALPLLVAKLRVLTPQSLPSPPMTPLFLLSVQPAVSPFPALSPPGPSGSMPVELLGDFCGSGCFAG